MTYIEGINAKAMDQFLGALESGKYNQGTLRLHTANDDSMCCLGVATSELGPQCGVVLLDPNPELLGDVSRFYEDAEGNRFYLLMPPSVTALLGIPSTYIESSSGGDIILVLAEGDPQTYDDGVAEGEYYKGEQYLTAVSRLNDNGVSFADIARRIRETFTVRED